MRRSRKHHGRFATMGAAVLFWALALLAVRDSSAADPPPAATPTGTPAAPPPDAPPPPTEAQLQAGKSFFLRGQQLFHAGKYGAAWVEFSSAYEITSSPDLIINMARCKEKLNHPLEATEHYREFLRLRPDDPEAPQIRAEIARLEQQMNQTNAPPPAPTPAPEPAAPPPSRRPFPLIGTALVGGTVLFILFGSIAVGVGKSRYDDLAKTCKPNCTDDQVSGAKSAYNGGYAMFGLAAATAVAAAVMLPYELGLFGNKNKTALRVGPGSLSVVGRF